MDQIRENCEQAVNYTDEQYPLILFFGGVGSGGLFYGGVGSGGVRLGLGHNLRKESKKGGTKKKERERKKN